MEESTSLVCSPTMDGEETILGSVLENLGAGAG
ncbi:MAG: hypothetical protein Ct9H300mP3_00270 [Gammaproteobacteria bacterium]|nr:MAG: hypothetical protein Ct9H300mP3_00270 [Gammaproteobacteria bacterium]